MKKANSVLSGQPTTIFTVMSGLAEEHQAINLSQGFPDGEGPEKLRAAAAQHIIEGPNQYPPMAGLAALRQAVAHHDERFYGIRADWQSEVLITSGATEALTACFMGLINPGDEAVLLEPVYDSYRPIIEAMGGIVKTVRLLPPNWTLPEADLRAAFSEKTKLIVVNSPMNPIGKVFNDAELRLISELVVEHDAYAICDEVYEHLIFDEAAHLPLITYPGMRKRSAKVGSAGKSFSLTGWKVGYVTAAPALLDAVAKAHQFLTFTTPPALQLAIAEGMAQEDVYFEELRLGLQRARDCLAGALAEVGFTILPCEGTYFLTVDFSPLGFDGDDMAFCYHITKEARVAAIPLSSFYGDAETAPRNLVRFCFCKEESLLLEAAGRLKAHFSTS